MVQSGDCLGFTLESFTELRGGNLDRDVAIQARVSGAINLTHATRTDGSEDFVRTKFVAGLERHVSDSI